MNRRGKLNNLLPAFGILLVFTLSTFGFRTEWKSEARLNGNSERLEMEPEEHESEEEESRPDQPDRALQFRRLQLQDEKGLIPPDGLEKARQHVALMKAAQKDSASKDSFGAVKPDSWTWLGPGNIGGRIRTIVIHPTNTNTMFVGSVGGSPSCTR